MAVAATVALPAIAGAQTFNTVIETYTGSPGWLPANQSAVADYNGDGNVDAVITDSGSELRLLLGNGNGSFNVSTIYVPGASAGPIRTADFNADGRPDIVFGSPQGNLAPAVLTNTGNVGGTPQFVLTTFPAIYNGTRSITVGDLNGDGNTDFIAGSSHGNIHVYLNAGNGTFGLSSAFNLAPSGEPSAGPGVIADLNGDGKTDFAIASNQAGGTLMYLGNGDGTFATRTMFPNNATQIAAADVNGDSKVDLLLGNIGATGNELLVYLNQGAGTFAAPLAHSTGGTPYQNNVHLSTTDVNGDGKVDVAFANSGSHNISVFVNTGNGSFAPPVLIASNLRPLHVQVGDFTGDGKLDLATVGGINNIYGVMTNTTPAAVVLPTQTLTILGGNGSFGEIAANVEYFNPATGQWQPTYLVGGHPWGQVPGTNSWINYKPTNASDPGAGPTTNQTKWYLYRVRFTVPADAIDPTMAFSIKADNFVQVAINGVTSGGSTRYLNFTNMPNVIDGQADALNADAVFSQAIQAGENTITLNVGDFGGLNGFNFRIDLTMKSSEGIEIIPVDPDTTAPAITDPGDITVEAIGATGTPVSFSATATDDIDGPVAVTANPVSGTTFPIGMTSVALTATDAAGNQASATFNVTVQDTIAPVVNPQAAIVAEATSAAGAAVAYPAATATDAVGVVSIVSNPPSGSTFPLGITTVTSTARDAAGNTGAADFTVTVVDTTAPVITSVSGNLIAEATSAAGAAVSYDAATATDAVGVASITYSSASGSTFALGTTTVTVTATDAAGNSSQATFTITVRDTTAPALASVAPSQGSLWPPNHQMVGITLSAVSTDAVGVTSTKIIGVTSSEPDNGLGDGDTAGDFVITGAMSVNLRAERAGKGSGRTYTITVESRDAAGNVTTKTCTVSVPKSQGGK